MRAPGPPNRPQVRSLIAAAAILVAAPVAADLAVVVHPDNRMHDPSARDIADLYLGRGRPAPMHDELIVLDLPPDNPLRHRFFARLVGMNPHQVNAYWARLQFSGDTLPPFRVADAEQVITAVSRNRRAIGYVDARDVVPAVRVVLRLYEQTPPPPASASSEAVRETRTGPSIPVKP